MARRVQSEKGAAYFGVPVGSLITPDAEDDAKAKHAGRPAPPGSVTGSNQKRAGTLDDKTQKKDDSGKVIPNQKSSEKKTGDVVVAGEKWAAKGFITPTIDGPISVFAGKAEFNAPEGSGIYKSEKHPGRVYVVTPDNQTHVLTSKGELNLTPAERTSLTSQVKLNLEEVVELNEEEDGIEVTWVRLQSLARQIEQAAISGDTSQVKKLIEEFNEASSIFNEEVDPRELRTKLGKNSK